MDHETLRILEDRYMLWHGIGEDGVPCKWEVDSYGIPTHPCTCGLDDWLCEAGVPGFCPGDD